LERIEPVEEAKEKYGKRLAWKDAALRVWQSRFHALYVRDEKDKIWEGKGEVGDIGELGLICEEIGEAMRGIRKKKGLENLSEECGDIIVRTLCFMARKGIDAEQALLDVFIKVEKRNRKGLFFEEVENP